jgi:hypothetical protein
MVPSSCSRTSSSDSSTSPAPSGSLSTAAAGVLGDLQHSQGVVGRGSHHSSRLAAYSRAGWRAAQASCGPAVRSQPRRRPAHGGAEPGHHLPAEPPAQPAEHHHPAGVVLDGVVEHAGVRRR